VGFADVDQAPDIDCYPPVIGISVFHRRDSALATVRQRVRETLKLLGLNDVPLDKCVVVYDDYIGGGYGEPTDAMIEAVSLAARLEGLLLDPVYTGKTLSGLMDLVRQGFFKVTDNVVFWHTGGIPALFAYREALDTILSGGG
jgi:1-aminocyclopropane-1-carboxylate deaminase/D-cysteine desulfhydrase-like pyridoxal-dependent ACC family enzyme